MFYIALPLISRVIAVMSSACVAQSTESIPMCAEATGYAKADMMVTCGVMAVPTPHGRA